MKCLHNQSFISVRNPNSVIMTLLGVTEGRPEDIVSLLYFWFFCANVSRASFSHTHCWGSARRPTVWYVLGWLLLWTSRSWRFCETQKSQQRNNAQVCCLVVEPLLFKGLKATTTVYCLKTNYAYSQWNKPCVFSVESITIFTYLWWIKRHVLLILIAWIALHGNVHYFCHTSHRWMQYRLYPGEFGFELRKPTASRLQIMQAGVNNVWTSIVIPHTARLWKVFGCLWTGTVGTAGSRIRIIVIKTGLC